MEEEGLHSWRVSNKRKAQAIIVELGEIWELYTWGFSDLNMLKNHLGFLLDSWASHPGIPIWAGARRLQVSKHPWWLGRVVHIPHFGKCWPPVNLLLLGRKKLQSVVVGITQPRRLYLCRVQFCIQWGRRDSVVSFQGFWGGLRLIVHVEHLHHA